MPGSDPFELSTKLSFMYQRIADYFGNNKLVINSEKTHLLVAGTKKQRLLREQVSVSTGSMDIKPIDKEKGASLGRKNVTFK